MGSTLSADVDRPSYTCAKCGVECENGTRLEIIGNVYCIKCSVLGIKHLIDEKTAELQRTLDGKNAELEFFKLAYPALSRCKKELYEKNAELESSVSFLRLGSINDQPDYVQNSDVVIVVQGSTDKLLHAHKFMLSSKSPVFRTMFNVNMSEEATGIIHIDDATLPTIRAMINFCYNAEIDFTDEVTADEVLALAHKYEIVLLYGICEKHLIKTLDNRNLAKMLRLAKKFDAAGLEAAASKYLKDHYDHVIGDVLEELF